MTYRRTFLLGSAGLALSGCFDRPYYEKNPEQKQFLEDLGRITRAALNSGNPLQMEHAAQQCLQLAYKVNPMKDWLGLLRKIEGTSQDVTVTIEIGPQVTLYSFNDSMLRHTERLRDLFSRTGPRPMGLSREAVAALKTFRLNDQVLITGRAGDIAGSGLSFGDLKGLLGRSEMDYRQFLQAPRFVASIETLGAPKKS
jgi:hypothetical protein